MLKAAANGTCAEGCLFCQFSNECCGSAADTRKDVRLVLEMIVNERLCCMQAVCDSIDAGTLIAKLEKQFACYVQDAFALKILEFIAHSLRHSTFGLLHWLSLQSSDRGASATHTKNTLE